MPNASGRFGAPWRPGSDAYNADPNSLLRADNVTNDEQGISSLRQGLRELPHGGSSPIVSLCVAKFGGAEKIVSVDTNSVYIDGELIEDADLEGSGDIALGVNRGHLLIINGSTKYKYDGDTLREWGIRAPASAPAVEVVEVANRTVANFSQASDEFTASEGTKSYVTGYDGTANAATGLLPAVGTGRGIMSYAFADTDLLNLPGGEGGDYDVFSLWVDDPQPERFTFLVLDIGISAGSDPFLTDFYTYQFGSLIEPIVVTAQEVQQSANKTEAAEPVPPSEPNDTPPPPPVEPIPRGPGEGRPPKGPIVR